MNLGRWARMSLCEQRFTGSSCARRTKSQSRAFTSQVDYFRVVRDPRAIRTDHVYDMPTSRQLEGEPAVYPCASDAPASASENFSIAKQDSPTRICHHSSDPPRDTRIRDGSSRPLAQAWTGLSQKSGAAPPLSPISARVSKLPRFCRRWSGRCLQKRDETIAAYRRFGAIMTDRQ